MKGIFFLKLSWVLVRRSPLSALVRRWVWGPSPLCFLPCAWVWYQRDLLPCLSSIFHQGVLRFEERSGLCEVLPRAARRQPSEALKITSQPTLLSQFWFSFPNFSSSCSYNSSLCLCVAGSLGDRFSRGRSFSPRNHTKSLLPWYRCSSEMTSKEWS